MSGRNKNLLLENVENDNKIFQAVKEYMRKKYLSYESNVKSNVNSNLESSGKIIESNGDSNVNSNPESKKSNGHSNVNSNPESMESNGDSNVNSNPESIESNGDLNVNSNPESVESNGNFKTNVNSSTKTSIELIGKSKIELRESNFKSNGNSNAELNVESNVESNKDPLETEELLEIYTRVELKKSLDNWIKDSLKSQYLVHNEDKNRKIFITVFCEAIVELTRWSDKTKSSKRCNKCLKESDLSLSSDSSKDAHTEVSSDTSEKCIEQTVATNGTIKNDDHSIKFKSISYNTEDSYESVSKLKLQNSEDRYESVSKLKLQQNPEMNSKYGALKTFKGYTVPQKFYDHFNGASKMDEEELNNMLKLWASDNWKGLYDPPSWLKSEMFCMALKDEPSNKIKVAKLMEAKYYLEKAKISPSEQVPEVLKENAIKSLGNSKAASKASYQTECDTKDIKTMAEIMERTYSDLKFDLEKQTDVNDKFREEMIQLYNETKGEFEGMLFNQSDLVNEITDKMTVWPEDLTEEEGSPGSD